MIIFKEDASNKFDLFKQSINQSKFISVDCEMTGVVSDINTDGTKYDTAEIRYYKQRKIAKMFGLIQIGITCYLEGKKDENEYYIERTFTFYLFKKSKFGWLNAQYPNESKLNLFNSLLNCHPMSIKFLSDNGFDFNLIFSKGLHYNKLEYKERIIDLLKEHISNGNLPNNVVHLSKEAEEEVMTFAKELMNILRSEEPKKTFTYEKIKKEFVANYILGVNWRKILNITQFTIKKDKKKPADLVIEKSKTKLDLKGFVEKWSSIDDFKSKISFKEIFESKYASNITDKSKEFNIDKAVEDELGFSLFIEELIKAKKPIIGHNPFLDLLFIYENCIGDLPEDYLEFKQRVHFLFPVIIDTRYLVTRYEHIFDKRGIENIVKKIKDKKLDEYVEIIQDQKNGFAFYSSDQDKNFHDAGYDSYVTGRIFISLLKAIENRFEVSNKLGSKVQSNNNIIVESQDILLKKGFVNFEMLKALGYLNKVNFSIVSEAETLRKNDICFNFNLEEIEKDEHKLTEKVDFRNTFFVQFKETLHIYQVTKIFTDEWNTNIVMARDDAAFVEFLAEEEISLEMIRKKYQNDIIEGIYTYEEYKSDKNYKKFLKF